MRRRQFLKAALGTAVGVCLPLETIPRAEPPLSPIFTPGIWAGKGEVETFNVDAHTLYLHKHMAIIKSVDPEAKTVTYSHYDYSSLAAFEAREQRDLVSGDEVCIVVAHES